MWEPVKPTLAVAQDAYQVTLELCRAHPDDADLAQTLWHAKQLLETI